LDQRCPNLEDGISKHSQIVKWYPLILDLEGKEVGVGPTEMTDIQGLQCNRFSTQIPWMLILKHQPQPLGLN